MSTHHGKDGNIKLGATGGTAAVAELQDWSYETNAAVVDDTAQLDDWDTHLPGQKSWNGQATVSFDPTDTNGQLALAEGASAVFNLYAYGAATGKKYKTGTATITKVGVAVPLRNKVTRAITFQGNGALTDATVGA